MKNDPAKYGFTELWTELDASAAQDGARWWIIRCRSTPGRSLLVAREPGTGRRAVLLPLNGVPLPSRREWPHVTALTPVTVVVDGMPHAGVILAEARFADVFDALSVDLARRVEDAADSASAVLALLGQIARWQRFLASAREGLEPAAQRGLWGELHCLHNRLLPALGGAAVVGWKGPTGAHQDFQFPSAWIEVKTTLSKQPQTVRITSERQLDETFAPALFLHVLMLETQEGGQATLPALVAQVRSALGAWPTAREPFEEALLAVGYLDRHAPRYAGVGYAVRQADDFRVGPEFPRIIEADLPVGVGDASYQLSLAACAGFTTPPATLTTALVPLST